MSAVLGVSCGYHDAAAALVVDGRIVAAIQEERLTRVKNDPSLPRHAIAACLAMGGIEGAALDRVVFYESPYAKLERVVVSTLRAFPRSLRPFSAALSSQLGDKLWILDRLARTTGVRRERVECVGHHASHAASAFFGSGLARAAVLTVDGVGEWTTTAIHLGEDRTIRELEGIAHPDSLGLFYAALTAYLGFEVNEGEQKVMGLAAFGRPTRVGELERVLRVDHARGRFALARAYFADHADDVGFSPALETLLGARRPPGLAWDLGSERDRGYADVAASLASVTEDAMLALARRARALTDADALCLAGGVALNVVANARIARESGFARVHVHPAPGDAGGALGAAILGALALGDPRPEPVRSAALGPAIDAARGLEVARALGLRCERVADPADAIAARLARGEVVALATGRLEWGPRALGQRSLLADPTLAGTRDRINRAIKRREPFRPFAPSVLEADAARFFDEAPSDATRFMSTVCRVRDAELGAVTHEDGTARVHTVEGQGTLARVLAARARAGEKPVVLNTSLNGRGEPICASAEDAIGFLLSHPIDALYIEDVSIEPASGA